MHGDSPNFEYFGVFKRMNELHVFLQCTRLPVTTI